MIGEGDPLGVAVSGGPDSVALLDVLRRLAPERKWTISVLHLNHGWRGAESEEDAAFVERLAARWGLEFIGEQARLDGGNLEGAGRMARARFYARGMREHGLVRIATGHTRSDQAETVLFRLLRGGATTGLAGIIPVTREGIVRPLIDVTREEVIAYLGRQGLVWREDSTNADPRFARNRIRHQLLPALEKDWNPKLREVLARTARVAQDEDDYWRNEVARWAERVMRRHRKGVVLEVEPLRALPLPLIRRLLREAVDRAGGGAVGFEHVEAITELVSRTTGTGGVDLPVLRAVRSFGQVLLGPPEEAAGYRIELCPPAEVEVPGGRLHIETADCRYNLSGPTVLLEVRNWLPGDAYCRTGRESPEKIKDLWQRARVPLWDRAGWPMVLMNGKIIWTRQFGPANPAYRPAAGLRIWEESAGE